MKIKKISEQIRKGQRSAVDLAEEHISRVDSGNDKINCYIEKLFERAREKARQIDDKVKSGENPGLLCGIPVAVKDNMVLKGTPATCGSKILKNYVSPYTATAVEKLEQQGAVIVGKTNMDEFAMGSSGENSAFGPTKNPVDLDRIPGGSSSGSAATVADKQVLGALGSDTGGSIRQPAAMCGVVGLKPTYGLVSRYGLVAFASSLDQIGPLCGNVEDAAVMLKVIAGHDSNDSTGLNVEIPDYTDELDKDIGDITIGIPQEYMAEGLSDEIRQRIKYTAKELEKAGCTIKEVSLPHTNYAVSTYYIVAPAEASANLARYDGMKYGYRAPDAENLYDEYTITRMEGFGPEVKRRMMIGTYALSSGYYEAYYLKAQKVRTLMKQDFEKVFKQVDVIFAPTSPTTAFKLGEKIQDPLQMYLSDIYTISSNLVGIPGINIPLDTDSSGLPIGGQLMGPYLSESILLRVARKIEKIYETE